MVHLSYFSERHSGLSLEIGNSLISISSSCKNKQLIISMKNISQIKKKMWVLSHYQFWIAHDHFICEIWFNCMIRKLFFKLRYASFEIQYGSVLICMQSY